MERIDGVDNAAHSTWFGGIYQEPRNFFAQMPVVPEELFDMYPEFVISDEHKAAWLETRSGVLVGRGLMDRFDWKLGDRIPINATIWGKQGRWPNLGIRPGGRLRRRRKRHRYQPVLYPL